MVGGAPSRAGRRRPRRRCARAGLRGDGPRHARPHRALHPCPRTRDRAAARRDPRRAGGRSGDRSLPRPSDPGPERRRERHRGPTGRACRRRHHSRFPRERCAVPGADRRVPRRGRCRAGRPRPPRLDRRPAARPLRRPGAGVPRLRRRRARRRPGAPTSCSPTPTATRWPPASRRRCSMPAPTRATFASMSPASIPTPRGPRSRVSATRSSRPYAGCSRPRPGGTDRAARPLTHGRGAPEGTTERSLGWPDAHRRRVAPDRARRRRRRGACLRRGRRPSSGSPTCSPTTTSSVPTPRSTRAGRGPYDVTTTFHEPLVLFGYLAAVTDIELVTGIIILPQRQTVLVAKQAAEVDLLSRRAVPLRRRASGGTRSSTRRSGSASTSGAGACPNRSPLLRRLWTERVGDPRRDLRPRHRRRHQPAPDPATDPGVVRGSERRPPTGASDASPTDGSPRSGRATTCNTPSTSSGPRAARPVATPRPSGWKARVAFDGTDPDRFVAPDRDVARPPVRSHVSIDTMRSRPGDRRRPPRSAPPRRRAARHLTAPAAAPSPRVSRSRNLSSSGPVGNVR